MKNKKVIIILGIILILIVLAYIIFNLKENKVPIKELAGVYNCQELAQDDNGNPTAYLIKLTIEDDKTITLEESDSYNYVKTTGTYKYSKNTITYKRVFFVEIENEKEKLTDYSGNDATSKLRVIDSHNLKYTYKSKELTLTKLQ